MFLANNKEAKEADNIDKYYGCIKIKKKTEFICVNI